MLFMAIDRQQESPVDSVLSMHWSDYRTHSRKAKLHLGFNLSHAIPGKLF